MKTFGINLLVVIAAALFAFPTAGEEKHAAKEGKNAGFEKIKALAGEWEVAKGPAEFTLTAILGEPGDPTDNPTTLWPEDQRKSVKLGTISISALEDNATCDAGVFDPTNVVDGIEGPENDKIFPMRSQAYAVSFSRRAK